MPALLPTVRVSRLDPGSPLPLHAQAERALRELMLRPEYRDSGLLPDEISLSRSLGVSRNTLRSAIGRLVTEGRLERKAGVGTRVTEPQVHSGIGAWHSFTREMEAKGIRVEMHSMKLQMLRAGGDAARALKLAPGARILCLDRVRGWDGRPEAHFRSCLHPRVKLPKDADFQKPLYELIQAGCGLIADQSIEEMTAVAADRRLSRLLGAPAGSPLLRRERTVLDRAGRPMEFAIVHYRCERFRLTLTLRQE